MILDTSEEQGYLQNLKIPKLGFNSEERTKFEFDRISTVPDEKRDQSDNSHLIQSYREYLDNINNTQKDITLIRKYEDTLSKGSIGSSNNQDERKEKVKPTESTENIPRTSLQKEKNTLFEYKITPTKEDSRLAQITKFLYNFRLVADSKESFSLSEFEKYLDFVDKESEFTQTEIHCVIGKLVVNENVWMNDGYVFFI